MFNLGLRSNDLGKFSTPLELAEATAAYGCSTIHLVHYKSLDNVPDPVTPQWAEKVNEAFRTYNIRTVLLSGSCNPVHPDENLRELGIRKAIASIEASPALGYPIVTTETGSIDPSGCIRHADNTKDSTWALLCRSIERVLRIAEDNKVTFSVEPCADKNIVSTPQLTLKLMEEFRSPYLKVLFDAINILPPQGLDDYGLWYEEAVSMLRPYIAALHFKDFVLTDDIKEFPFSKAPVKKVCPAGEGLFPWADVISIYRKHGLLELPATLESAKPKTMADSLSYIRKLANGTH